MVGKAKNEYILAQLNDSAGDSKIRFSRKQLLIVARKSLRKTLRLILKFHQTNQLIS